MTGAMSTQQREEPPRGAADSELPLSGEAIASGAGIAALVVFMVENTEDVRLRFLV
jgi:hypothetical protein